MFKAPPLKKNLFYIIAFALLVLSFLFFNGAYKELIRYAELTNKSNTVYSSFQNLSRQINNAALLNPDLIKAGTSSKAVNLFFTDSQSVIHQIDSLKSIVQDSINIEIAEKLNTKIKSELLWILKSNVPDSIIHHTSTGHIASLQSIDSLIKQGIQRTIFLLKDRKKQLNKAINTVRVWMILFIMLSGTLLFYTTINLFRQQSKRKEKEKELKKFMDSSLDVLCAVDAKDYFLQVSAACETVWGYTADELISKPLIDFVYPEDREKTNKTAINVMAGNNMTNFENRYIRKDGSLVPIARPARWDPKDQIRENDNKIEIKSGLQTGDAVVTSGAYLLNSEYIFKKGARDITIPTHQNHF